MSEMVGYDGPIYMTHPTKAICPILLVILENKIYKNHFYKPVNRENSRKNIKPINGL